MTDKIEPLGVCDTCGETFPETVSPYTSKGVPRLCCSRTCRNALNSRRGAGKRSEQAKARVRLGEWENPSPLVREDVSDEELKSCLEAMAAGVSRVRKAEVETGIWRNPALGAVARKKLSRPRVHTDNPLLHRAFERLRQGASVAELSVDEREAHRSYRRELYAARRDEDWRREWYRR